MLDITTITRIDIASVVGYYADAKDDYYSKDSSFTAWHGQGAEALGLSGEVSSQRFKELLVGEIDPFTQMKRSSGDATIYTHLNSALTATADRAVFARHQYRPDVTENGNGRQRRPGYSDQ